MAGETAAADAASSGTDWGAVGTAAAGIINPAMFVLSVASMVQGRRQRKKAAREDRLARIEEAKQRAIAARRQRIQLAQERQVATANVVNAAANTGTMDSSGALGAVASVASQEGTGVGYANSFDLFGRKAAAYQQKSFDYQAKADKADANFQLATVTMNFLNRKE